LIFLKYYVEQMLQRVKQLNTVDKENVISFIAIFAPVATRVCLVGVVVVKSAVSRWSLTFFSCCDLKCRELQLSAACILQWCQAEAVPQRYFVVFFCFPNHFSFEVICLLYLQQL
jgi:hypothetical protein